MMRLKMEKASKGLVFRFESDFGADDVTRLKRSCFLCCFGFNNFKIQSSRAGVNF